MNFSNNGINILKQLEGCVKVNNKHVIYDDKNGLPINIHQSLPCGATIGYGHLIKPNEDFTNGINENVATELLRQDIISAEQSVKNNIHISLSQNQYDALVIFAYNIGSNNFAKSNVVKYINNPNFKSPVYPNLESSWKAWNKSAGRTITGLCNRRNIEWNLFNNLIV